VGVSHPGEHQIGRVDDCNNTITRAIFVADFLKHQGRVMGGWRHDFGNMVRSLALWPKR
jgi:hypothetical protein